MSAAINKGDHHFNDSKAIYRSYGTPKSTPTDNQRTPVILVAIPCFNEEVAIGSIILRSLKYADRVVVIDDGSTDKTAEIAKLAGAEVITHKTNQGKGAGIRDAFRYAKKFNADILVLIDGDGQHNPDEIPRIIEPILKGKADIVNGSRFLEKNGNHVPKYRRVGQEILTLATNFETKRKITDTQNGFRAFSKNSFNVFAFEQNGMGIESEMLIEASNTSLRIIEVPINVRYDVHGSTYNPVSHGFSVLNTILGLISQRRPLLSFGVPGMALIMVGLVFCILVLEAFNKTKTVATGYAMIFMLCTILGVFCIFTGLMLWSIQNIRIKADR